MDTRLVTFISLKGGVGKSTHLAALAAGLLDRGRTVLIIDTDGQGTAEEWAESAIPNSPRLTSAFLDLDGLSLEEANRVILEAAQNTDYVLMDTPGSATPAVTAAMLTSDLVLSPFMLTKPDIAGLERSQELLNLGAESIGEDPDSLGNMVGLYVSESSFISNARRNALSKLTKKFPICTGLPKTPIIADWMETGLTPKQLETSDKGKAAFNGRQRKRIALLVDDLTTTVEELFNA